MTDSEFRIEHDSMGDVRVPANAKWRAQTQRAVENFPISGQTLERSHIEALARIKAAAATVNAELGVLTPEMAAAVNAAAVAVAEGGYDDHFPIDVFQTGSGTSSNMNTNEVIATIATEAAGLAGAPQRPRQCLAVEQRRFPLLDPHRRHQCGRRASSYPSLEHLAEALERKASQWATVVKSGRTHLMDATPVTLGQEFGGYAAQVRYGIERLQSVAAAPCRAAPRRHGRRHRHQHPCRASPPRSSPRSPVRPDCR